MSHLPIYIGCEDWSVGREQAAVFPIEGTHLQRYGSQLSCVEINSSFHRPHRHQTYVRRVESCPKRLVFCVKSTQAHHSRTTFSGLCSAAKRALPSMCLSHCCPSIRIHIRCSAQIGSSQEVKHSTCNNEERKHIEDVVGRLSRQYDSANHRS